MRRDQSLKQIKMSAEQHAMLKAVARSKARPLYSVCGDAIERFVSNRLKGGTADMLYIASPKNGSYQSYWVPSSLLDDVATVCQQDDISESRVIYTAFVRYLQKRGRSISFVD